MNKIFEPLLGRTMEVFVDNMIVKRMQDMEPGRYLRNTFEILQTYDMKLNPKKWIFAVRLGKFRSFMISSRGMEANSDNVKAVLEMRPPRNIKRLTECIMALGCFMSKFTDKCQCFYCVPQGRANLV